MRRRIIAACLALSGMGALAPPAHAIFGVGDVVIDPTNLVQNILTAANTLEQINNQIEQLQNDAQMLINQAEDLASLDYSSREELERLLEAIGRLFEEADEITYETERSHQIFSQKYPDDYKRLTHNEIVVQADQQWKISQDAFRKSITVQSEIVGSIARGRQTLGRLMQESQSATGNLSVAQAGNQLIALSVEQQMQMQSLMAVHYRMIAVEEARRNAIEAQARARHQRFRGDGSAYTRN